MKNSNGKISENIAREKIAPGLYKYYSAKPRIGWTLDKRSNKYVCFGIDVMIKTGRGKGMRRRHRDKPFASQRIAEAALAKLKVTQAEKKYDLILTDKAELSLKDAFARILPTIENRGEFLRATRISAEFLKFLPAFFTVGELSKTETVEFVEHLRGQRKKDSTIRREINSLSSVIRKIPIYFKAYEKWTPPQFHRPQVSRTGREKVFSTDERESVFRLLLDSAKRKLKNGKLESDIIYKARRRTGLLMYFALMTSLRHGDVCRLRKSWYDEKGGRLKVYHQKTDSFTIYQPVPPTMRWILTEAGKLFPESEFFFSEKGKIQGKTYAVLAAACRELGFVYGRDLAEGLTVHTLRHTVTTALQHNRVDPRTTQSIRGDRTLEMTNYYTHASTESRAVAMEIVEREFGKSDLQKTDRKRESYLKRIYRQIADGKLTEAEFIRRLMTK